MRLEMTIPTHGRRAGKRMRIAALLLGALAGSLAAAHAVDPSVPAGLGGPGGAASADQGIPR